MSRFLPIILTVILLLVCSGWTAVAWSADAVPGEELCDREIDSIVFTGNKVTRDQTLLREIDQRIDTPCSIDRIVDSIQSIMDLGLFRSVIADLALKENALQLRFSLKEKHYFLVIPRISRTSDGELRGGVQLRFDNFLGRLHEMRITSERRKEDDGNGPGGFVHRLNYDIPRFLGGSYGLGFELASDRRQVALTRDGNEFGLAQSETQRVSLVFSRWMSRFRGVQGIRTLFGARFSHRSLDVYSGEPGPFRGGDDVALIIGIENKQLHRDTFRRRGTVVGGRVTVASSALGSEFDYTRADLYAEAYIPLDDGIRNLNLQLRLGMSDGAAFGEHAYSVGGGEKLRGLESATLTGDSLALLNVEYLHAWFNYPQWRWVVFSDIGGVYQRDKKTFPDFRLRGGVGLRRKLMSLSNTDIRLDLAWDPSRDKVQTYVSSNLTF